MVFLAEDQGLEGLNLDSGSSSGRRAGEGERCALWTHELRASLGPCFKNNFVILLNASMLDKHGCLLNRRGRTALLERRTRKRQIIIGASGGPTF